MTIYPIYRFIDGCRVEIFHGFDQKAADEFISEYNRRPDVGNGAYYGISREL